MKNYSFGLISAGVALTLLGCNSGQGGHPELLQVIDKPATAVAHHTLALFAANFWNNAKAGPVTAHDPMSIMIKTDKEAWTVAISNPTRSWGKVSFELEGAFTLGSHPEQRISLGSDGQITADLHGLRGSSYLFTLYK